MRVIHDLDANTVTVDILPTHGARRHPHERYFTVGWNARENRVGQIVVQQKNTAPVTVRRVEGEIEIRLRHRPIEDVYSPDEYVSVDLPADGTVCVIHITE